MLLKMVKICPIPHSEAHIFVPHPKEDRRQPMPLCYPQNIVFECTVCDNHVWGVRELLLHGGATSGNCRFLSPFCDASQSWTWTQAIWEKVAVIVSGFGSTISCVYRNVESQHKETRPACRHLPRKLDWQCGRHISCLKHQNFTLNNLKVFPQTGPS